jgi:hypothetical protein
MNATRARLVGLIALVIAGTSLTACGGNGSTPAAPGSPEKPLVAEQPRPVSDASGGRSNEAAPSGSPVKPGYQKLVEAQPRHPRTRFTPCNLVTAAQARAIIGAPMQEPVEAPQGPTCVYRSRNGKSFVTVAVQRLDFKRTVKPRLRLRRQVDVSQRTGYCGTYGQPMLYVPLAHGQLLSVAGQCAVAKKFAIRAVRQLG